jgi:alcohol dehydrogenase class IV
MPFDFSTAQRIVFGPGTAAQLPAIAQALGRSPLLVTGRNPSRHAALLAWRPRGLTVEVAGEPDFDLIRTATAAARAAGHDSVIAIGGGSVIDAGKAIAMLLANGGDPLDYAEVIGAGRPVTKPSVPLIALPTTAGAGSEVTRNAVLRSLEHTVKVSLRSPLMLPAVALVDPDLTLGLPPATTAATGLDALSQLIEPFVSSRANAMTDPLCRDGIARIARSLPVAFADGANRAAREDLALAALFGGMALANAGLGAVHGFAAAIGGQFEAPHGAVCAALLAPVMEANSRVGGDGVRARYDEVARLVTGRSEAVAADGVAWVRDLTRTLRIPRLRLHSLTEAHVDELCTKAAASSSMKANPVALDAATLRAVLLAAL